MFERGQAVAQCLGSRTRDKITSATKASAVAVMKSRGCSQRAHCSRQIGSLDPETLADFMIVDRDRTASAPTAIAAIAAIAPIAAIAAIAAIQVLETWIAGCKVWACSCVSASASPAR